MNEDNIVIETEIHNPFSMNETEIHNPFSGCETIKFIRKIIENNFNMDKNTQQLFLTIQSYSKNKFECLYNIFSNIFITDFQKSVILETFCKFQRFIYGMTRLKYIWRLKRSKIYNTDDLYLNPICIGDKNVIAIFCNNTRYVFHIRELIGSINNSLSNSSHFFPKPLVCKNPYTNIPFNKSTLYNIYFAIRSSTFIMPTLFHIYFLSGFNFSHFATNNEHMINDEYIQSYVQNNCYQNILMHVNEMFEDHKINIRIHRCFPKDILFTIMKPYLELYYMSSYSMNENKKIYHYRTLHKKLHEFVKHNPAFGRRTVKMVEKGPFSKSRKINYYFNDNCPRFYPDNDSAVSVKSFMNSHLCSRDCYSIPWVPTSSRLLVYRNEGSINSPSPTQLEGSNIESESESESDSDDENEVIYRHDGEGEGEGEGEEEGEEEDDDYSVD